MDMEPDSAYESYGSDTTDGSVRSCGGTPHKPNTLTIPDRNTLTANIKRARRAENLFYFIVGKQEERMEIKEKELVMLCKSSPMIAKLVISSKHLPSHEIKVPEWDTASFKTFLTFMQVGGIKIEDLKEFGEIVRLCIKFKIPKLLESVCSITRQNISLENCLEQYQLGSLYDLEELRISAFGYFLKMGNAFVQHPKFLELDCIAMSVLISNDDFAVVEITLFRRLIEWVKAQCKRLGYPSDRQEFFGRAAGLLFRHIRYSQMTQKDFQTEVIPSGLLNEKDIEGITLRHSTNPNHWYTLPPHGFVDRPRLVKLQFAVPLYNNVQIGFRRIAGETSTVIQESVRFMVSHDIYLTSIGFFGPAKNGLNGSPLTTYAIKIHVEGDYSKHHSRCPSQNATVITRDPFTVDLSNPYQIQKLQPYKLTVWIDGDVTQFGVFPLPQAVVFIQDRGEFITFHFGDADSDPQPGLDMTGRPSSSAPLLFQPTHPTSTPTGRPQFKPEPRSSGVIRCISFTVKD